MKFPWWFFDLPLFGHNAERHDPPWVTHEEYLQFYREALLDAIRFDEKRPLNDR